MLASGTYCVIDKIFWKKPPLIIRIPSSLGNWSTMITRPIPALNPVRTGSDIKFAMNQRRKIPARNKNMPTRNASVVDATTSYAMLPPGAIIDSSVEDNKYSNLKALSI